MSRSHQNSNLNIKNSVIGLDDSVQLYLPFTNHANDVIYGVQPTINSNNTITENGIAVEEATTNLISNGNFSDGTAGWSLSGGIGNATIYTTIFDGKTCLYQDVGWYDASNYMYKSVILTASTTYTLSFLVYRLSGNIHFDPNGPWDSAYIITPEANKWVRYTYTFTTSATGGQEDLHFYATADRAKYYLTDVQLEQKSFATSFVNGSRSLGVLEYDNILRPEGTVNFDFVKDVILTSGYQMPFRVANNTFEFNIRTNVYLGATVDTTSLIHIGERHTATISWSQSGNSLKTYLDGAVMNSATCPSYVTQFGSTTYPKMYIGCGDSGGNFVFDGVISDFILFNRALSDDEVKTLSNSPFKYNSEEGVCL